VISLERQLSKMAFSTVSTNPAFRRKELKQTISLVEISVAKAIDSECYRHLLKYSKSSSLLVCLMFLTNLAQAIMKMVKATNRKICQSMYDPPSLSFPLGFSHCQ